ncbi:MAG: UDP-N-acetylmuramoyl-L-alanyl-D-glutamate--2,6-diaminopimelate ligase [Anaeroplasmataceae bacterium]|nr:UDP-N-acetylmuramoyl-L-alanyl-D-glutamate--2,6-diaminopimelate ligase [Anaeroplasmataceae bacterium]
MKINTILKQVGLPLVKDNHWIKDISFTASTCTKDTLFIALKEEPLEDIKEAIGHGVQTIISKSCKLTGLNHIVVDQPRKILALVAKYFYKKNLKNMKWIGVIGTNGKTTTSTIAYHFFNSIGKKSMLIGSNGVFFSGYEQKTNNTTPDILTIYEAACLAKKKKVENIFMEVSSISVDQWRVYGIEFDALVFTNFSQDHLDYHKTLEHYLFCKLVPFIKLSKNSYAILNKDEEAYLKYAQFTEAKLITYGMKSAVDLLGTLNTSTVQGISFYMENQLYKTKLLGQFNIYNCLAVLGLCKAYKIPYSRFKDFISQYTSVSGRMNVIEYKNRFIMIDYAHTFSATKQAIEETLKLCRKNLTIVLGCGGNREKEKRRMIGKLLGEVNARVILTTDNPRFENPKQIIKDIQSASKKKFESIVDRTTAIHEALNELEEQDFLLVLGKGSEEYIDIQGVKYPYSDQEVIYEWISNH